MRWIAMLGLLALASCGVDGPPSAPTGTGTGVTVGGDARIGVVGEL